MSQNPIHCAITSHVTSQISMILRYSELCIKKHHWTKDREKSLQLGHISVVQSQTSVKCSRLWLCVSELRIRHAHHRMWLGKSTMSCAAFKIDQMNKRGPCLPITQPASILVGDMHHKHLKSFQGWIASQSRKWEFYEEHMNTALRVLLRGKWVGGRGICQILQDSVKIIKSVLLFTYRE